MAERNNPEKGWTSVTLSGDGLGRLHASIWPIAHDALRGSMGVIHYAIRLWARDNLDGDYCVLGLYGSTERTYRVAFSDAVEATAFKIRWG